MLVLSWNVQWCRGMDGRVDVERVVRTAQHLGDPDILCFQEVASGFDQLPGSSGEDQFALIAALLPGWTCIEGIAVDLAGPVGRRRFGNLICSRLPVLSAWRHSLPWPPDPAHPSMQRVAVETVIASREHTIRVITCHLEYYSGTQRAAQVECLRELQHEARGHDRTRSNPGKIDGPFEHQARPDAAILCGDFNFLPDSTDYGQLQKPNGSGTRWHDAWPLCHGQKPHLFTNRLHDRSARKKADTRDFFFVSETLTDRLKGLSVDAQTQASDHQPVMLELAL